MFEGECGEVWDKTYAVDRHEPEEASPEGLLYELELFDLSSGSYIEYFQQYVGDPKGRAESELQDYLQSSATKE